jgi:lipopolysaccharide/colanic/teichoic acid biosynthesis glycosyltransferase
LSKRLFDLAVVLLTLPIWLPILGLALFATAIESGLPVFFKQERMGLGARPFTMIKVRTMKTAVAPPSGALFAGWTYRGDPRVTRVGSVLRRYRVDELPQLLNVLRGDMSLVGPRPEPWGVAGELASAIRGYTERHRVLPGITGLCQISPCYGDFGTIEKSRAKLQLDLQYVERASFWLDVHIIARTVAVLLRGSGIA